MNNYSTCSEFCFVNISFVELTDGQTNNANIQSLSLLRFPLCYGLLVPLNSFGAKFQKLHIATAPSNFLRCQLKSTMALKELSLVGFSINN